MTITLSLSTLDQVAKTAAVPAYSREEISPGILHFGVGNFHRAHQAVYLDALFNAGKDRDWAILGAGTMPSDAAMRDKLSAQDYLTTVVEQDVNVMAARVTGVMAGMLPVGNTEAIIAALADPKIRIVSLTITEGGYFIDASGSFNPAHPAIVADASNPTAPKTVFGLILAGLQRRRSAGIPAFTVMSCDNIPHNGKVTMNAVAGLARLVSAELADWVMAHVAFPNSMVDRITPATGPREIEALASQFGIADQWPVFCEEFKQWVMEDNFPLGRPAFETVGVTFVSDVSPYELMKIRILNGGHAAIAYPAALLDVHFVHEAMEHPLIRAFLAKLENEEIIPVVPPVPDTSLAEYFALIERRFLNPKIGDTIPRLAQDGSNRQPKFILPSTADRLARNESITGLSLVSALWCRYFEGETDSGKPIAFNDVHAERLHKAALASRDNPEIFLMEEDVFGTVNKNEHFRRAFAHTLQTLRTQGTARTLQLYLDNQLALPA